MVRNANFADIPGIVRLLKQSYLLTHYAVSGLADIDEQETKRLLMASIQRHGGKHGGACWAAVSENGAAITGLLLGTLARVYVIGNRLMATDLLWIAGPDADPRDAAALMKGFVEWAKSCPHVVEIRCGTTAVINDPADAGKLLERIGMKHYGNIYRMEVAS